jgi:hypothetical protein
MDNQQIYITNSTVKYPFDDQHTYDIANDIVLDMSLSVPEGVIPVVTVLSITESVFFMAVEDSVSKDAIGHFIISLPKAFRIYPMNISMEDSFGWIVLGPGRNRPYENRLLELELDPSAVAYRASPIAYMDEMEVDGIPYTSLVKELGLNTISPYVNITVEDREITGLPGESGPVTKKCIVFSRDDSKFQATTLYGGMTESGTAALKPATSLGGAEADDDLNVDIVFSDVYPITTPAINGLLLYSTKDVCPTENLLLKYVKHGRCDLGENETTLPLPLDQYIEEVKPYYADKNCGCDLSSSSSTGRSSSSSMTDISSRSSQSSTSKSSESRSSRSSASRSSASSESPSSYTGSSSSSIIVHSSSSTSSSSSSSPSSSSLSLMSSSSTDPVPPDTSSKSSSSSTSSSTQSGQSGIVSPKGCWYTFVAEYDCATDTAAVNPTPEVACTEIPMSPPDEWFYYARVSPTVCQFIYTTGGQGCNGLADCSSPPVTPEFTREQLHMQFCSCWTPLNCHYQFSVDYTCATDTFSPVVLIGQTCTPDECIAYDWEVASQTATTCTYIKTMCFNHTVTEGCGVPSECEIHFPGVPDDPTDLAACGCAIVGACCTAGGQCRQTTEGRCALVPGDYRGQGLPCDPNPCQETCVTSCPAAGALGYTSDSPERCKEAINCDAICGPPGIPCSDMGPGSYAWYIGPDDPDNAWGCDCCCTDQYQGKIIVCAGCWPCQKNLIYEDPHPNGACSDNWYTAPTGRYLQQASFKAMDITLWPGFCIEAFDEFMVPVAPVMCSSGNPNQGPPYGPEWVLSLSGLNAVHAHGWNANPNCCVSDGYFFVRLEVV